MIQKLFMLVVTVMAVHGASTAPRHQQLMTKLQLSITDTINAKLDEIFSHINEPLLPKNPIELRLKQANVADVYIKMENCDITGVKSFAAYDSFVTLPDSNQMVEISISLKSPKVTLNSKHYTISGTMVDHVELFGNGPGMISVDDMDIKVKGHGKVNLLPFSVVFDTAILDLEMWRWTVNLEDLMPGTDLGTVFNEFFTMYGPEIFDIVENNINKSGKLLDFLNSIFP